MPKPCAQTYSPFSTTAADTPGTLFADINFAMALSICACFSEESFSSSAEITEVAVMTQSVTANAEARRAGLRRFCISLREFEFISSLPSLLQPDVVPVQRGAE